MHFGPPLTFCHTASSPLVHHGSVDFWSRVDKSGDCWLWTGARDGKGYGRLGNKVASRLSWELSHGPIPRGKLVCHKCDNPPCVRPDHLFLGSPADNFYDMVAKGRGVRPTKAGIMAYVAMIPRLSPEQRAKRKAERLAEERRRSEERVRRGLQAMGFIR